MQRRIVSLVPSLTHMLVDFGLQSEIVGCTQFCVKPPNLRRTAAVVGGTKDPDLEAIERLKPTHILVNEEENKPEHIAACRALAPTFLSFPKGPLAVPALLRDSAAWLGVGEQGELWATRVEAAAAALEQARASGPSGERYLYLIWREPYMAVGAETYISAMLAAAGLTNAAAESSERYPTLSIAGMQALKPSLLLLSSEPYPFRSRDQQRLANQWPGAPRMLWIDGQLLSWYGTMTVEALTALAAWLTKPAAKTALIRGFS